MIGLKPRNLLNDYWQLIAKHDDRPEGIKVDSANAIVAPCGNHFYDTAPISKIEIYAFSYSGGECAQEEDVAYDQAILFQLENGKSFCVACQLDGPGIATDVHSSEEVETIRKPIEGSRLRLTLTP